MVRALNSSTQCWCQAFTPSASVRPRFWQCGPALRTGRCMRTDADQKTSPTSGSANFRITKFATGTKYKNPGIKVFKIHSEVSDPCHIGSRGLVEQVGVESPKPQQEVSADNATRVQYSDAADPDDPARLSTGAWQHVRVRRTQRVYQQPLGEPTRQEKGRSAENYKIIEDVFGAEPIKEDDVKKREPVVALSEEELELFQNLATRTKARLPGSLGGRAKEQAKSTAGAISMLEELFPKELKRKAQVPKKARHIPKAPLDMPTLSLSEESRAQREHSVSEHEDQPLARDQLTVVLLSNASKHLTEHDFRRVMPGGRHIEGWSKQGDLLKIIRSRDTTSLERNGAYILVFSSPAAAQDYVKHAESIHAYCRLHSPRDMFSSLPPPPSLHKHSQTKLTNPVYNYTLMPPSHSPGMRLVTQPFVPVLQEVVRNGGFARLSDAQKSPFEVLLSLSDFPVTHSDLRRMIRLDGRSRGVFWETVSDSTSGIRRLDEDTGKEARTPRAAAGRNGEAGKWVYECRKFVVSFVDEQEASRFAMSWHQRDVTDLVGLREVESESADRIICTAETTW